MKSIQNKVLYEIFNEINNFYSEVYCKIRSEYYAPYFNNCCNIIDDIWISNRNSIYGNIRGNIRNTINV